MPVDSLSFRAVAVRACLLILGWVVLVAVFVGAGHVVVGSRAINGFDRHITTWVVAHRTLALDVSMRMITWIGSWIAVAATAVVVLVAVVTKRLMAVALANSDPPLLRDHDCDRFINNFHLNDCALILLY